MAGIDRTTIITGPALVTYNSQTFWSKGNITVRPVFDRFGIETSSFGKLEDRIKSRKYEISFEPAGRFTSGLAGVLWPYGSTAIGASIYGATDKALVVQGKDGLKITFHNAAVTQMPVLRIGVDKTVPGPVTFTALLKLSTDPTDAAAYYTSASNAYPGDTGFALSDIHTKPGVAVWGASAPWDSFVTEAGWEISFGMSLTDHSVDNFGVVDMRLSDLNVTAKAIPVGPTAAQVLSKLPSASALGATLGGGDNLVISTTTNGPEVTLTAAVMHNAELVYGAQPKRIGACEWMATRTFSAGAAVALFAVAVEA